MCHNGTLRDVHVYIEVVLYDIAASVLREAKSLEPRPFLSNHATKLLEDLYVSGKAAIPTIIREAQVISLPLKHVSLSASPDMAASIMDGKLEICAKVILKVL